MKKTFATLVRDSSARSFSLRTTAADAAILAVLVVAISLPRR